MTIKEIRKRMSDLNNDLAKYEGDILRSPKDGKAHGLCLYVRFMKSLAIEIENIYEGIK